MADFMPEKYFTTDRDPANVDVAVTRFAHLSRKRPGGNLPQSEYWSPHLVRAQTTDNQEFRPANTELSAFSLY